MKKICFITESLSTGGAERMVANLANSFSNHGYNVNIIAFRDKIDYEINSNVNVLFICKKNKISKIIKLRKLIKQLRCDVYISFLEHICMATVLSTFLSKYRKRIITTIRNNPKYSNYSLKYDYYFLKKSRYIIFQNDGERSCFPNIDESKCIIIPNYYNSIFYKGNREYNDSIKKIITVGRLEKQKNLFLLLDAFSMIEYKNITLEIVGKGSLKNMLIDKINQLNLSNNVNIIDWTNNVKKQMEDADLFVSTSLYEGMPNAIMEAMANGLPVISTNCEYGPSDLIDSGKTGFLVENNNLSELVYRINYCINNYTNIVEVAKNGQKYICEEFSEGKILQKWIDFIDSI